MNKKVKVTIAQFLCFAALFLIGKFILSFTDITRIWNSLICAVFATVFAPQFKIIRTQEGEKVYMAFLFRKKITELNW